MSISNLSDYVLESTKNVNSGSSLVSLIPFVLFFWNLECLAHTFLKSLNGSRGDVFDIGRLVQFCLKNIITSILLWSGALCWSHGLIRFLNIYTAVFLTTINGSLKTNHQISQTAIDTLESVLKWIVCYAVAEFVRLCDIKLKKNCYTITRIRRFRRLRLNNWDRIVVPRRRQINELGEDGVILSASNWFPGLQPTRNSKPMKFLKTQSCLSLTNITPILSKQTKKRSRSV